MCSILITLHMIQLTRQENCTYNIYIYIYVFWRNSAEPLKVFWVQKEKKLCLIFDLNYITHANFKKKSNFDFSVYLDL